MSTRAKTLIKNAQKKFKGLFFISKEIREDKEDKWSYIIVESVIF